ncbi:flagellar assembly protein FliW [Niallia sp. NCCP-28]|uniref:flagellar assembly protein FliW n=1 Tax=Niallia sp. NCCP-28 TaxID=2934712 RepID=UPI00207DCFB1|nr:flagellar assembly protein FliW [Niallia sp. NCCP-28]GKU83399.1 flagellar assembly factor FliW [Niallia sp. NCCP-28]
MKINTKYHGEKEIKEKEIISFVKPIPGFPDEDRFIVLPLDEEGSFFALQSIQNEQLAFVISNPFLFFSDYDFNLEENAVEQLELASEKDVLVFAILTVQEPFEKTTANLQAPIILNQKKNLAKQVILNQTDYITKHLLLPNKKSLVKG